MLDDAIKAQLAGYLTRVIHPVELVASLDDSEAAGQMRTLIADIAALGDKVSARYDGTAERRPSFQVTRRGENLGVAFAAIPMGHEFTSLVLALLQAGGHPPKVEAELIEQVRALDADLRFETWMSLTCHNCPDVVQALNLMAVLNPRIRHVAIDGALFRQEVESRGIMAVPAVFLNGQPFGSGRMELSEILAKVDTGAAERDARKLAAKDAFDMLIVGGGPAGAAAAVYAARKGIRTGIVAERMGGQTLDTMGIENFVSVLETQGPKFAAALEAHTRAYDVDLMAGQRVASIEPGETINVTLDNGAVLKARSLVLATGARWRKVGVPGEAEYANKGVAYCPHCDGPLFKGKDVAVIGGGNSGVEAAIDLAGIVRHVTLVEYAEQLKADAVLVAKLKSLPNVTDPCERAADRDRRRRRQGLRAGVRRPGLGRAAKGGTRRRVRADRAGAQHRVREGRGRDEPLRRDPRRRALRDQRAGDLCRGRCDDGAVQADRHRRGRGRQGGAVGLRPSDPHAGGRRLTVPAGVVVAGRRRRLRAKRTAGLVRPGPSNRPGRRAAFSRR